MTPHKGRVYFWLCLTCYACRAEIERLVVIDCSLEKLRFLSSGIEHCQTECPWANDGVRTASEVNHQLTS